MKFVNYLCRSIIFGFIGAIFLKVYWGNQSFPEYYILITTIIGAFAADVDKSKEG